MFKEVAIVAGCAALGEWLSQKYGAQIQAKAVAMKVPVAVAHAGIVGGAAALGYLVVKAVL